MPKPFVFSWLVLPKSNSLPRQIFVGKPAIEYESQCTNRHIPRVISGKTQDWRSHVSIRLKCSGPGTPYPSNPTFYDRDAETFLDASSESAEETSIRSRSPVGQPNNSQELVQYYYRVLEGTDRGPLPFAPYTRRETGIITWHTIAIEIPSLKWAELLSVQASLSTVVQRTVHSKT